MTINTHLSTITSTANQLNAPIKRQMEAEQIKRHMFSIRDLLHIKRHTQTEIIGMEKVFS